MTTILTELSPTKLPKSLTRCGYRLDQIHRSPNAAVYSVTDIETGTAHGFEVFQIKVQSERTTPNGIHFAHKERYPANEDFGVWAFAPRTKEKAFQIFGEMEIKAIREKPIEAFELAI